MVISSTYGIINQIASCSDATTTACGIDTIVLTAINSIQIATGLFMQVKSLTRKIILCATHMFYITYRSRIEGNRILKVFEHVDGIQVGINIILIRRTYLEVCSGINNRHIALRFSILKAIIAGRNLGHQRQRRQGQEKK